MVAVTPVQRRILAAILTGTALILVGYPFLAWWMVGFSFGSFVLYGLFPALAVYFAGMALFMAVGTRRSRPDKGD